MVRKARGQPPNELLPSTGQKLTRAPACQSWCGSSPDILGLNLVSRKGALWEIARHSRIIKYVMPTLLEIFPDARQLLALEPEELAGALIEIIPGVSQSAGFMIENFTAQVFSSRGGRYRPRIFQEVVLAFAEALSWLEAQGLVMRNAIQPTLWYLVTRSGRALTNRLLKKL
jgi:hypothetical protein